MLHLVRLRTYKYISYSPQALANFNYQKDMFIFKNRMDVHYDYHCSEDVPYQAGHVIVYNAARGGKPWFVNSCTLFLLDLLMFGWV